MAQKFRYEKILKLREDEEQAKKHLLAAAQGRRDEIIALIEGLKAEKLALDHQRRNRLNEGLKASEMQWFQQSEAWFSDEIEGRYKALRQAELDVIQARVALVQAAQERKKFEKLKELDQERQQEAARYQEAQLVDGIVTYQSTKKQGGFEL